MASTNALHASQEPVRQADLTVTFKLGTDLTRHSVVRTVCPLRTPLLPEEVRRLGVKRAELSRFPDGRARLFSGRHTDSSISPTTATLQLVDA